MVYLEMEVFIRYGAWWLEFLLLSEVRLGCVGIFPSLRRFPQACFRGTVGFFVVVFLFPPQRALHFSTST